VSIAGVARMRISTRRACTSNRWPSRPVARCPIMARIPMLRRTAFTSTAWLPAWRSSRPRSNSNVRHR